MRYQVRYQTMDGKDEPFAEATTFLDAVRKSNYATTSVPNRTSTLNIFARIYILDTTPEK